MSKLTPAANDIFLSATKVYTLPYQKAVKDFYLHRTVQILVAFVIFMNFITAAMQAEIQPDKNSRADKAFRAMEWFYVYAFLIELIMNMYGHYFWAFWRSGWNWFDFIIVLVSLMAIYFPRLPAISVLRLFRAFRIVRLFKRVREMRKIIEGIMKSLPSLSYAFVALGLITGIWAIIGVDYFKDISNNGEEGYYFGNFFRAVLSLGQITTFDSWSSGIARDIIYEKGTPAAIYFVSFIFIAGIIMMNVLVALLLDNYLKADPNEGTEFEDSDEFHIPKEAIEKMESHFRDNDVDLKQFAKYLNEKAFPEFIDKYYRRNTVGGENPADSPSAIEIQLEGPAAGAGEVARISSTLSRIEMRLFALGQSSRKLKAKLPSSNEKPVNVQTSGHNVSQPGAC
jgi:voltage-gated sodium channel